MAVKTKPVKLLLNCLLGQVIVVENQQTVVDRRTIAPLKLPLVTPL
jgi:hypothetical protein